ncbi:MAG: endonuclease III [bacterium]|nr:endonuclease III [bacterium]
MNLADREATFKALALAHPNPVSELTYRNPFELLVAVILSAQATDISVNKVTPKLFEQAPNPQAMKALGVEGVKPLIKTIGLFNNKAKNIVLCAAQLIERHGAEVPEDRKALEALAGVGVKTAGVVMNVAFGAPVIPVDTHVFRVSNRLGLVKTDQPEATEAKLLKVVPKWALVQAHHLLILQGRYICKARKPLCGDCQVTAYCAYFKKEQKRAAKSGS